MGVVNLLIPVFNVSALLHDITKQKIVMEQQRNIIRMMQDLKSNNVHDITESNHLSPKRFPIKDLRSLTSLESDPQSCLETR